MNEHTKGEWKVGQMHDDGSVYVLGGQSEKYICSVQIKQTGGGAIASAMESERLANARLIAAAPALLEACERYVRMQDEINAEMGTKPTNTMYQMMKAAIAKAKEQQNTPKKI